MDLTIFEFDDVKIRTATKDGEPWFCLRDVCEALEINNHSNVAASLEGDDLHSMEAVDSIGRVMAMNFVNESGLYQIIFQSRKEEAKRFKKWVAKDVLPQIRKTGSYSGKMTLAELALVSAQRLVDMEREQERLTQRQIQVEEAVASLREDLPTQIQDAVDGILERAAIDVVPFGCLTLVDIRRKYFKGISQSNISQYLHKTLHPSKPMNKRLNSKEIQPVDVFAEEGLREKYLRFLGECTWIKETDASYIIYHPAIKKENGKDKNLHLDKQEVFLTKDMVGTPQDKIQL